MKNIIIVFLFLGFGLFCQEPYPDFTYDTTKIPSALFWEDNPDMSYLSSEIMTKMSNQEILAQTILTSWSSPDASNDIKKWIKRGVGGIKIFGWNVSTLDKLAQTITDLQKEALDMELGIPLVVATDQEGGWVRHIKDKTSFTPGNLAIGATRMPFDAYYSALYIGEEIRNLGVNMNLAPTVDIYESLKSDVIGPRAFSSDAKLVSTLSLGYYNGLEANRIISTAKHFPGHGNTDEDSHGFLPIIDKTIDDLWDNDFLPYRTLVLNKVPSIMVGHLNYPSLSKDDRPATISKKILSEVVRDKMGFSGVLITDDMYMASIQNYAKRHGWDTADLIVESQKAGMNFILISRLLSDKDWDKLNAMYKSDFEFQTAVKESCKKILQMKIDYLREGDRVPLSPSPLQVYKKIPSHQGAGYFENHALRSTTVIKGEAIPFVDEEKGKDVLVISQDSDFISTAKDFFPKITTYKYSFEPRLDPVSKAEMSSVYQKVKASKMTIFNLVNPKSLSLLQGLSDFADKIIVISSLTPALLNDTPWVKTAIAVYGWSKNEYRAGFFILTGKFEAQGTLPIKFDEQNTGE